MLDHYTYAKVTFLHPSRTCDGSKPFALIKWKYSFWNDILMLKGFKIIPSQLWFTKWMILVFNGICRSLQIATVNEQLHNKEIIMNSRERRTNSAGFNKMHFDLTCKIAIPQGVTFNVSSIFIQQKMVILICIATIFF